MKEIGFVIKMIPQKNYSRPSEKHVRREFYQF
jgi:hypothetical protein